MLLHLLNECAVPNVCYVHAFLYTARKGKYAHKMLSLKIMSKELAQYNDSLKQTEAISFANAKE